MILSEDFVFSKVGLMREVAKWLVRLSIAGMILSLTGMPYLVAVNIQKQLSSVGINIPFIWIMASGILGLIIGGFILDKSGFLEIYQGYVLERNKEWQKMRKENKE